MKQKQRQSFRPNCLLAGSLFLFVALSLSLQCVNGFGGSLSRRSLLSTTTTTSSLLSSKKVHATHKNNEFARKVSWQLYAEPKNSTTTTTTASTSNEENAANTAVLETSDGTKDSKTQFNLHNDTSSSEISQFLSLIDGNDGSRTTTTTTTTTESQEDIWLRQLSSEVGVKKFLGLPHRPAYQSLPLDVVFERTLDTIEDVVTIIRRKPYDYGFATVDPNIKKPTIVVLGSGWAAHALMKVADTYQVNLVVVSPVNHFVFTPMLASAAVGSVEYRSMTEAVRQSNPMVEYIQGKAIDIDVKNKKLTVELSSLLEDAYKDSPPPEPIELNYDSLVCAIGTKVKNSNVKGADDHCYYLKTTDDSRKLRTAIGEALEYASRPDAANNPKERKRRVTFCIVGGGPTGVELAGELSDFFADICRPRKGTYPKLKDDVQVMVVHGGPDLVSAFDKSLRAHALESLKKKGVQVKLNTYTTKVGDGYVTLQDKYTGETETVPVGITIWAAGIEAQPFSKILLSQLPPSAQGAAGRINVDAWMRAPVPSPDLLGSIYILGDAAAVSDRNHVGENGSDNLLLPQTAQVAGQQGAYLARLFNRGYNMTTTPPSLSSSSGTDNTSASLLHAWLQVRGLENAAAFTFLNLGLLAYVGGGDALAAVQIGDVPVMSYAGSVGFLLWRSVYLVKQVATRNRVLVTFDWIKTIIFGRDVTRL